MNLPDLVAEIERLRTARQKWPSALEPSVNAGIVISASGRLLKPLYSNLSIIRRSGCRLPIDVWYLPGEFTARQIDAVSHLANFVQAGETPFNEFSGKPEVYGFKAWIVSQSRFRKTLLLDVNSFPLRNVEFIFEQERDCIMWQDGSWRAFIERISDLRRRLGLPVYPFEFESGQFYVDRTSERRRDAIRLAAALNTLGMSLYDQIHGDKETYALAFDFMEEPFSIAPEPEVYPAGSEAIYGGVIQPWLDGSPLFYHPMATRDDWWRFRDEWSELEREASELEEMLRTASSPE